MADSQGGIAVEAAGGIHTDLAKRLIRAKNDEPYRPAAAWQHEIKAHGYYGTIERLLDPGGDILLIRHN